MGPTKAWPPVDTAQQTKCWGYWQWWCKDESLSRCWLINALGFNWWISLWGEILISPSHRGESSHLDIWIGIWKLKPKMYLSLWDWDLLKLYDMRVLFYCLFNNLFWDLILKNEMSWKISLKNLKERNKILITYWHKASHHPISWQLILTWYC